MFHARLNSRILETKESLRVFLPLEIWMGIFIVVLIVMGVTRYYVLVPFLALEFLCIIPVFFICKARMKKAVEKLDGKYYEADLEVKDRILYYGNIPLKIYYNPDTKEISLKHEKITGKYHAKVLTFWSRMHPDDVDDFLIHCKYNHVNIRSFKRKKKQ